MRQKLRLHTALTTQFHIVFLLLQIYDVIEGGCGYLRHTALTVSKRLARTCCSYFLHNIQKQFKQKKVDISSLILTLSICFCTVVISELQLLFFWPLWRQLPQLWSSDVTWKAPPALAEGSS